MEPFWGRQKELSTLERLYTNDRFEFFPVYGRRRVGKSELLLHSIKSRKALYFLGKRATAELQIREFMEEAARLFEDPLLGRITCRGWQQAIETAVSRKPKDQKLILIFDEFQWTAQASPELPSVLQALIDRQWSHRKDIVLILCGSYMGFMEKEVLGEKSPLFGRRTGQIFLRPFSYLEAAAFHKPWSLKDRARCYFVCGGIPYYLKLFDRDLSFQTNLIRNFFDEFSALYREPDFLLREELRELQRYYAIFMSLAAGSRSNRDIADFVDIDERKLSYYLNHLMELRYVAKHQPVSPGRISVKNTRYVLDDSLLRFWFRFIYPNMAHIIRVGPERAFQELAKPHLESFFGTCFERLCREALPHLLEKDSVSGAAEIVGEYWDPSLQIDVVGLNKKERIDLGECKWGRVASLAALTSEFQDKIKRYPNPKNLTVWGWIFLQDRKKNIKFDLIRFRCLEDLYDL